MKKATLMFLVSVALAACNQTPPSGAVPPPNNPNEALVQQYFRYFNQHDWAKMAAMYTETAQFKDPSLGAGIVPQTRTQIAQKYAELNAVFPDVRDSLVQVYPAGAQHVVVEFVSKGTAPDGSAFELPICTIFTFENGLISRDFTYYDNFEAGK